MPLASPRVANISVSLPVVMNSIDSSYLVRDLVQSEQQNSYQVQNRISAQGKIQVKSRDFYYCQNQMFPKVKKRFNNSPTYMAGLELHEASSSNDYDALANYLKSGKYDVNQKDNDWSDKTALHWACAKGFADGVRLLLEYGAKGTARTITGWTPAHFAAEAGKLAALRALHNAHVPIDKKDNYGATPRRIAYIYKHMDCIDYLQQAEIDDAERRKQLGNVDPDDDEYIDDMMLTVKCIK